MDMFVLPESVSGPLLLGHLAAGLEPVLVPVLGIGAGLERDWSGIGTGLERDWNGIGTKLDLDLDWIGFGLGLKWYCNNIGTV